MVIPRNKLRLSSHGFVFRLTAVLAGQSQIALVWAVQVAFDNRVSDSGSYDVAPVKGAVRMAASNTRFGHGQVQEVMTMDGK